MGSVKFPVFGRPFPNLTLGERRGGELNASSRKSAESDSAEDMCRGVGRRRHGALGAQVLNCQLLLRRCSLWCSALAADRGLGGGDQPAVVP